MLQAILRKPGSFVLRQCTLISDIAVIFWKISHGFRTLFRPAGIRIFLRQVYFTSVQPVSMVVAVAFVVGAVIVHYVVHFFTVLGAHEEIGGFIILIIVNELSSVFIAILVMIRSGSAVISEIALMKLNRELDTLRSLGIDMYDYLFFPRFAAMIVSNVLLAVLFCSVALLGGFIAFGYLNNVSFYDYIEKMAGSAVIMDFVTVYVKSFVFGHIIALIAIRDGLSVEHSISEVPVYLIHGLVTQMMLIVTFDLLYDMIRYANFI
ncbi:putative phospholipid ABC transporter permease protein MlaE [bacterium BMS3Abin07]|nr:putative phospholipid ABC transporter permease protein MlaE [bacterium BMS3Abin07]GBE31800.1 putative phospholipid ABC transporter permease protein MlaE [bacterium BMS3Bbin05]HDO21874.1 ABC transporter permease [Nitrospirota bacterium]HDZ88606.1 ABC transporter permease [Nitrospirota bacterium]